MKHERKLLQLVQVGDIQRVYKHLHRCGKSSLPLVGRSKRVNVNFQLSNGLASLHLAAMSGNVDIMEMLVAQGADVDLADSCGLRPLHYACAEGHTLAVHFLLTKGRSSANMPALDGMTPLHLACAHGHLDIVKLLLQHGADLGLTNVQRYTPLDFAYVYRQPLLISFLQQWLHKHGQTARKLVPNSSTTSPHTRNTAKVSFGQCTSLMPSKNRQFHTVNESPAIQLRHPTVTTGGNSCSSTSSSSSSLLQQQRPVSSLPLQLDSIISTVDRPPRPPSMSVSTSNTQSPYSLWLSSPSSSSGPSQQSRHQFTESRASPSFQQHPSPQLNGNSTLWNLQSPSTSQSFGGDEKSGIGNTSSSSSSSVLHTPKAERFSTPRTPLGEHEESKQNLKDGCFAVQARAVRHFTLGNISFLEGDLITVLRQYDEHWWKGYVTAAGIEKTGLFPADAVQLVDPSRLPLPPVQGEGGPDEEDVQNHRRTPVLPRPVVEETGESEHSDEEDDRPPMSMEEEEDTDGEHSSSGHASSFSAMEASLAPNSSCILLPPSMAPLYRGGVTFPGPSPQGGGSGATSPASPCTGSCGKCAVPLSQQQPSVAQQAHYRHSGASWDSGRGSAYASSADATPPASSVSAMNPLSTFCGTPMTASMMSQSGVRECSPMEPHRTTPPWPPYPLPRTMSSAGCCDCSCHAPSTTPTYTPWRLPSSEDPTTHLTYFLHNVGLLQHLERIMKAGYDIFTLSRATPEDLTALGITNPQERTKLKAAFQRGPQLVDPLPTSFPENLGTLLWTLGLGDYLDMLQKQGYRDCISLMELTWEDLEDLGVKKLGHLKKFMLLIERLKRVSIQLETQLESNLKISYQLPGCFSRPQTVGLLSSHREPSDSPPQNSPSGEFSHNTTTTMVALSAVCELSSVRIEPEGEPGPGVPTTCPSGCEFSVHSPTSSSSVGMLDVISMLQELENKLDVQGRKRHAHSVRPM